MYMYVTCTSLHCFYVLSENDLPKDGQGSFHFGIRKTAMDMMSSTTQYRGFWKVFTNGQQKVLLFTSNSDLVECISLDATSSISQLDVTLSLGYVGLSLVDDSRAKELAYLAVTE